MLHCSQASSVTGRRSSKKALKALQPELIPDPSNHRQTQITHLLFLSLLHHARTHACTHNSNNAHRHLSATVHSLHPCSLAPRQIHKLSFQEGLSFFRTHACWSQIFSSLRKNFFQPLTLARCRTRQKCFKSDEKYVDEPIKPPKVHQRRQQLHTRVCKYAHPPRSFYRTGNRSCRATDNPLPVGL